MDSERALPEELDKENGRAPDAISQSLGDVGSQPKCIPKLSKVPSNCDQGVHAPLDSELALSGACVRGSRWSRVSDGDAEVIAQGLCDSPAEFTCSLCGRSRFTELSLEIHMKRCSWRLRPGESGGSPVGCLPLAEECEHLVWKTAQPDETMVLGDEAPTWTCQKMVEVSHEQLVLTAARLREKDIQLRQTEERLMDWVAKHERTCKFCNRTFESWQLAKHERSCSQRPQVRRLREYSRQSASCQQSRSHLRERAKRQNRMRSQGSLCSATMRAHHPDKPPQSLSVNVQTHRSVGKAVSNNDRGADVANSLTYRIGAKTLTPRDRAKRVVPAQHMRSASFAPPERSIPQPGSSASGAVIGAGVPKALTPEAIPDELLRSSGELARRGLIVPAAEEDMGRLQAHLAGSVPSASFVGAFRVQHGSSKCLVYEALRASMTERWCDSPPDERDLWHGTSWATVPQILQHGFNRSLAGRHGTLLGAGTYFSADLAYSSRFCDRGGGGKDKTKIVLLARVIVGRYTKGACKDVEPPVYDIMTGERYDSTVDNVDAPTMFAVFRDFQALPLFLLEFQS